MRKVQVEKAPATSVKMEEEEEQTFVKEEFIELLKNRLENEAKKQDIEGEMLISGS
jgi:hypothetical protein